MRILGIDPGLRVTGYGIIEREGSSHRYVASGVIRSSADAPLPARLHSIFAGITELVELYKPQIAAVEIVFVNVNPQSTLLLGQARGAALTALTHTHVAVAEYTALQIKQSVVGYGRASKVQMQEMVKRLLVLPGLPSTDAADALAAALTHAQASGVMQSLSNTNTNNLKNSPLRPGRLRKGRASWR